MRKEHTPATRFSLENASQREKVYQTLEGSDDLPIGKARHDACFHACIARLLACAADPIDRSSCRIYEPLHAVHERVSRWRYYLR